MFLNHKCSWSDCSIRGCLRESCQKKCGKMTLYLCEKGCYAIILLVQYSNCLTYKRRFYIKLFLFAFCLTVLDYIVSNSTVLQFPDSHKYSSFHLFPFTLNRLLKFPLQRLASMDMPSATLWELIYLMERSLKILCLPPTIVM